MPRDDDNDDDDDDVDEVAPRAAFLIPTRSAHLA
jgi:hypothetical protein